MVEHIIKSPEEMEELGAILGKKLKGDEVICIKGELGAGKTTFVRGLAKGLGIKEGYKVRSPTFTIVNEYPSEKGRLIHIDLYRVKDFDFSEFINQGIVVIEWKEKGSICDIFIEIKVIDDNSRKVSISYN